MTALVYQGLPIRRDGEMLSLTDMWRAAKEPAARRPVDWLRLSEAKQFVAFLSDALNVGKSHLLRKVPGRAGETLAHWQIAFAYAKYLSPAFHAWCNAVVRAHMDGTAAPPPGASQAGIAGTVPDGLEDRSLREREHNLDLVARMQAMKGPEWAFALYRRLGLPVEEPEPVPPTAAQAAAERAFAADAFAVALDAFTRAHAPWTGTPRTLRAALDAEAPSAVRNGRTWPKTDQALGTALKRLTPDLKARGVLVGRRHSGERFITLALAEE